MPLRPEHHRACCVVSLLAALLALASPLAPAAPAAPATPTTSASSAAAGQVPDDDAVQDARDALRRDELMGGFTKERRLHWRDSATPERATDPTWIRRLLEWFGAFGSWLASSARAVVIVLAAIGVALLAVLILRNWRGRGAVALPDPQAPPTHVRGLDIRPDELPADVPAAARALWSRGDAQGALRLLYRALLSRLVHDHRAAIRDSSTEGDCVQLARRCLGAGPFEYVAGFVGVWLRASYAATLPDAGRFESLCAGFDLALSPAAPSAVLATAPGAQP